MGITLTQESFEQEQNEHLNIHVPLKIPKSCVHRIFPSWLDPHIITQSIQPVIPELEEALQTEISNVLSLLKSKITRPIIQAFMNEIKTLFELNSLSETDNSFSSNSILMSFESITADKEKICFSIIGVNNKFSLYKSHKIFELVNVYTFKDGKLEVIK